MKNRLTRPGTARIPTGENMALAQLTELIEIGIGQAHAILYSIEDIARLCQVTPSRPRTRVSAYLEPHGPLNAGDLSRKLLLLKPKVEENRASLRDLKRANLPGLQLILEDPEGWCRVQF